MKRAPLLLLLLALSAAMLTAIAWWRPAAEESYRAATLFGDQARPLPAFALVRHDGAPLAPADFQNRWSLLFFGYAHCPDICAPTLQKLTTALQAAGSEATQIVFVSTDAERDAPDALRDYVAHFHPRTWGVTGAPEALADFAKQLGAFYARRELAAGYLIDHSASVWLIDPEVRLAGVFTSPFTAEAMAADLARLAALP